jgi:hypothetical protein
MTKNEAHRAYPFNMRLVNSRVASVTRSVSRFQRDPGSIKIFSVSIS